MNSTDSKIKEDYEFNFENSAPNHYASILKQTLVVNLYPKTVKYFRNEANNSGITLEDKICRVLEDIAERYGK